MSYALFRAVTTLVILTAAAAAHAEQPVTHPCASEVDPSQRLTCYDRAFPPAVDAQDLAEQAKEDFGLNDSEVRARNPALARAEPPERIDAAVTAIRGEPGEGRTYTLENGQVWRQMESNGRARVDTGDRVAVKKGMLGGFLLITANKVPVRVKRIK